jgi:hypothetical protein
MTDPAMTQLVERIQRLEEARYKTVGQLNALRTIAMTALLKAIQSSPLPPVEAVSQLRAAWLPESPAAPKIFPGIDPGDLAAFQQEYEASISGLLADLERAFGLPK